MASEERAKAQRPTIVDVARAAGASVGSVSNVINGTRPVSDELRAQVRAAAESLGYEINGLARSLRRRRSNIIGLCAPDTESAYLNDLADELDQIATEHGYELIQALTRDDPELELRRVKSLLGRQTDGLILVPSQKPGAAFNALARAAIPTVIVDRRHDDARFSYVTLDNFGAMQDLVRQLVGLGHRRILFVCDHMRVVTTRERIAALEAEASARPGTLRYEVIERGLDQDAYRQRLMAMLAADDRPTALVTANSRAAAATIGVVHQSGLACPGQIALATFDDPDWALAMVPPLTTVRTPTKKMAEATWSLLIEQLNEAAAVPRSIVIATAIDDRASSNWRMSQGRVRHPPA